MRHVVQDSENPLLAGSRDYAGSDLRSNFAGEIFLVTVNISLERQTRARDMRRLESCKPIVSSNPIPEMHLSRFSI